MKKWIFNGAGLFFVGLVLWILVLQLQRTPQGSKSTQSAPATSATASATASKDAIGPRSSLSAVPSGRKQASSPAMIQAEAVRKIKILDEILKSKNDNDPRLDQEFNQLSSVDKQVLEKKYGELPAESRNQRGTVVFLLGRNLTSKEDFDFLNTVVSEPPCLSLASCSTPPTQTNLHDDGTTAVTQSYPQIMALKMAETFLKENPNSPQALGVLRKATESKSPKVRQMASSLYRQYSRSR